MTPLRVLLVSPVAGRDPPGGDVTYTESLVRNPPPGVAYETYDAALDRGTLIEHARRADLWRHPVLTVANKAVNLFRRRGLFWEPFRFFSVTPGAYDVVHVHVFSARFLSIDCPLVMSSGAPQRDLYLDRRKTPRWRVAVAEAAERTLAKLLKVNASSYRQPTAERTLVYTTYYRDLLVDRGYVSADRVDVVPICLSRRDPSPASGLPKRIGFVALDFDLKGGPTLLAAFEIVRRERPDAELWVVGSPPQLTPEQCGARGVTWVPRVTREQVTADLMPGFDVFAFPTPFDCFSYVMLEAMNCGLAIATSDYVSMPEAVDFGRAGLISPVGDAAALAANVLRLLDPATNAHYRAAAKARFDSHFSWDVVAPKIRAAYDRARAAYAGRVA